MTESMDRASVHTSVIEWGTAARTHPGEIESGDRCLVVEFPGGVLVAAVDGLGHGDEAARAAHLAIATVRDHAADPVTAIIQQCHARLLGTRGVVMTLASFRGDTNTMAWLGVGNVEGRLVGRDAGGKVRREAVMLRGGVVGYQLPPLTASVLAVRPGDTLVLATDGVRDDFVELITSHEAPQNLADVIMAAGATGRDDALIVVARYVGA